MTSNQIANKQAEAALQNADTNAGNLEETKRNNRYNNKVATANAVTSGFKNIGSGFKSFLGVNHAEWYNKNKQLVEDVARISFRAPYGQVDPFFGDTAYYARSIKGILRVNHIRTPGYIGPSSGVNTNNAVNIAAQNLYSYIRHANSGAKNYEPADLMMYILAMDELYALLALGIRIYTVSLHSNPNNWFQPKALVEACGGNETWFQNPAQIRSRLNIALQRAASFNVPNIFHFFTRHLWMASNVFGDSESDRKQLFVYTCPYYGKYIPEEGKITYQTLLNQGTSATGAVNVDDYFAAVDSVLSSLLLDEDIGNISGDIQKAFGQENMYTLGTVADIPELNIIYDRNVLAQLSGATVCGVPEVISMTVSQIPGYGIVQGEFFEGTSTYSGLTFDIPAVSSTNVTSNALFTGRDSVLINGMYGTKQTADDNMVATRLSVTYKIGKKPGSGATIAYVIPTAYGTEIVTNLAIYSASKATQTGQPVIGAVTLNGEIASTNTAAVQLANTVASVLWQFDWAPGYRPIGLTVSATSVTANSHGYYGDVENFAIISESTLQNMHTVAVQSMFSIPLIGMSGRENKMR